jgi:hypothetical protein
MSIWGWRQKKRDAWLVASEDFVRGMRILDVLVVMPFDVVCHVHVFVDMLFSGEACPRGRGHGTRFCQMASVLPHFANGTTAVYFSFDSSPPRTFLP